MVAAQVSALMSSTGPPFDSCLAAPVLARGARGSSEQQHCAGQGGHGGGGENADLGLPMRAASVKERSVMNRETVNLIPPNAATPTISRWCMSAGRVPQRRQRPR